MPGAAANIMPGVAGNIMPGVAGIIMPGAAGNIMPGAAGNIMPGVAGNIMPGVAGNIMPGVAGNIMPGAASNIIPGVAGNIMPGAAANLLSRDILSSASHVFAQSTVLPAPVLPPASIDFVSQVWNNFEGTVMTYLGAVAQQAVRTNRDPKELGNFDSVAIQKEILAGLYSKLNLLNKYGTGTNFKDLKEIEPKKG